MDDAINAVQSNNFESVKTLLDGDKTLAIQEDSEDNYTLMYYAVQQYITVKGDAKTNVKKIIELLAHLMQTQGKDPKYFGRGPSQPFRQIAETRTDIAALRDSGMFGPLTNAPIGATRRRRKSKRSKRKARKTRRR
jgi:hypothetical protein